jgi:MFS family permease
MLVSQSAIWLLAGLGASAAVFFVVVESRIADSPLLDLNLFTRNRMFAFSNITALLNYQAVYALTFLMSLYLQTVRQLRPQDAGLVLLSQPILMTLISPASGWLSDIVQPRILVCFGMATISVATALLSGLTEATPLVHIVLILAILGIGYGLFSSPNTNAVMGAVGRESFGVAAGTLATMRSLGQSTSLAISTWVLLRFIPSGILEIGEGTLSAPTDQFIAGLSAAFIVSSIISALGVAVSLSRGRPTSAR